MSPRHSHPVSLVSASDFIKILKRLRHSISIGANAMSEAEMDFHTIRGEQASSDSGSDLSGSDFSDRGSDFSGSDLSDFSVFSGSGFSGSSDLRVTSVAATSLT